MLSYFEGGRGEGGELHTVGASSLAIDTSSILYSLETTVAARHSGVTLIPSHRTWLTEDAAPGASTNDNIMLIHCYLDVILSAGGIICHEANLGH